MIPWTLIGLGDALGAHLVQPTPLGRPGKPEEIAATAAFLASDDSSFFYWSRLVADAGVIQVWAFVTVNEHYVNLQ